MAVTEEIQGLTFDNALAHLNEKVNRITEYPGSFNGRGIVICAGGSKYFPGAWVLFNILRYVGCTLPIEMWYLGPGELGDTMRNIAEELGVACIDALKVREIYPSLILRGWEVKPYAILHSSFREVILLDADNIPDRNPEFLFETEEYKTTGALFWPDRGRLGPDRSIWRICGVPYQDEPEFETGQIVVDKERCWRPLNLTMWMNEYSDFFYRHGHGDKETFHMAWRKLNQPYAMPSKPLNDINGMMYQHDFEGNVLFQHAKKWQLMDTAAPNCFLHTAKCLEFLADLRSKWNGQIN